MGELGWYHRRHGDHKHDTFRFLIERLFKEAGCEVKDTSVFKKKYNLPCEPDFYTVINEKRIVGNTRSHVNVPVVVEVESNATKQSIALKQRQYEESMRGIRLYVINLAELEDGIGENWPAAEEWLKARLPI